MQLKSTILLTLPLSLLAFVPACSSGRLSPSIIDNAALLPADGEIELQVDANGDVREIEYHVDASALPAAVIKAADEKLPGGRIEDCEKEYVGDRLYYEVTKVVGGLASEAMFTPDGKVYLMEIAIDRSQAPPTILRAADQAAPGGEITSVEKILNADDELLEYHVKKKVDGRRYKILIAPDGRLLQTFREVPAEIEVPVRP